MMRLGFVEIELRLCEGVTVSFSEAAEVSLDCVVCRRRARTVVFASPRAKGRCTPTGHAFSGHLVKVLSSKETARYEFEYEYSSFIDSKYPHEQRYIGYEKGAPTWARVNFRVTCGSCSQATEGSTQNNLVRPWTCVCACGAALYEDILPPTLGWSELGSK